MSKAPKQKKAQLHYQPYQSATAVSNGELQHNAMEFSVPDMPLHMDPVLSGLSSNLSRNLWDDWNENDGNFAMKFDMFPDDSSNSNSNSSASANGNARNASALAPQMTPANMQQQQQQQQQQQHHYHQLQQQQLQQQQLQQQLQHQLQHQMGMSMLASINGSGSNSAGVIPSSAYDVMGGGGYPTIRPSSAQSNAASSNSNSSSGLEPTGASDPMNEPRANYRRSLSEDLVSMLDENNELVFGGAKQLQGSGSGASHGGDDTRRQLSPPNGLVFSTNSSAGSTATTTSSSSSANSSNSSMSPAQQQQQMQMQQQLQQQLQRQQQLQQLAMANENARWFANAQHALLQQQRPDLFARRHSAFETAVAAASTTLTAMPAALRPEDATGNATEQPLGAATPTTTAGSAAAASKAAPFGSFVFPSGAANGETSESGAAADPKSKVAQSPSSSSAAESMATDTSTASAATTGTISSSAAAGASGPFGAQNGMMMPGFMMYPMPMMGNYQTNPMGMLPLQMPLGMNMGAMGMQMGAMGPMGMQLPLGMQMQMPMGMQLPMGMQMPMNSMGLPMGMQMPMGMQVPTPQSNGGSNGASAMDTGARPTDMEVTPIAIAAAATGGVPIASNSTVNGATPVAAAPVLKPAPAARALQPKDPRGPGFVSIARKPDEPEVSSILKSLMDEEAKKKEKKLERNRDSARESRKKQQSYVEALETGIKRLQINRDLVVAYRWGVTGPGFGPLPCPQSPQMYDWKTRISIVTGDSESFSNIQNPAGFHSLMRMNRQRRALSLSHYERERAVTKSFVAIGKRLAALRARVLEAQVLRTFSDNPLAAELSAALNLSADQKLQLQCHAQRVLDDEVGQMVKLFKVFFALRTEALRLHILSPSLESFFRDTCSLEQLQKLLQWTETHRSVVENALTFDA